MAFFEVPLSSLGFSQVMSDNFRWNYQQQFFSVIGAGTFGFLLSMPFAPQAGSEHRNMVDKFFKTVRTPIDFDNEIGAGNDLSQLTVIGKFGAAIAAFVALMLLIPNPTSGRIAILVLALAIGGTSAIMIKAGSKSTAS
jgi:hypothetical protein